MTARSARVVAVTGAAIGAVLFAYAVQRAGVHDILDGLRRVGWGIAVILALAAARFLVRAGCWRLCMPASARLSLRQAWTAFLAGDAIGNITPLGLLASEPTKVVLTRHHLATRESVASLALENLIYAASVVAMIGIGVAVLVADVPLPTVWRWLGLAALVVLLAATFVALRLMRGTWHDSRGERPRWRERLAAVRVAVLSFSADYRARVWRAFALDLVFHALAVVEIYLTLQWLVPERPVTLEQAVVFEALNRVITVVFKFVPLRIGVDEALSGALAPMLAVDPSVGVALAVVRKIRNLFWSGAGLLIVATHGVSAPVPGAPATDHHGTATAHRP
jgi:hypothetical protein